MATTVQNPTVNSFAGISHIDPMHQVPDEDEQRLRALVRSGLSNMDRVSLERIVDRAYRMGSESCHRAMKMLQAEPQSTKLEDIEQDAVRRAFAAARGDATTTAKLLGIGRSSVYRKLRKYGLIEPQYHYCPNCGYKLTVSSQ
jgi:DNA-binding NtrC family response regulator